MCYNATVGIRRALVAFGSLLCLTLQSAAAVQDQALPDVQSFLAQTRKNLRTDRALLSQYTYLERRREVHLTKLGKVELGAEQVLQVYPGLDPADTYRRLIEVDGKPRDPRVLEEEDRKHQKQVLDAMQKREHESPVDRQKREQRAAKDRKDDEDTLDDLMRVFTFTLVERQFRDGRPMIVVAFTPRPGAAPKTDDGRMMTKVKGRAWVSEPDHQVARVEFEMLEDMSLGVVLGKVYKGTTASVERRLVNGEVWLPAEIRFKGAGRALVRKFQIDSVVEYSDYKKFSVDTDTAFRLPK
jgi:hypothetical protein